MALALMPTYVIRLTAFDAELGGGDHFINLPLRYTAYRVLILYSLPR